MSAPLPPWDCTLKEGVAGGGRDAKEEKKDIKEEGK
jgi:hypothetical protein